MIDIDDIYASTRKLSAFTDIVMQRNFATWGFGMWLPIGQWDIAALRTSPFPYQRLFVESLTRQQPLLPVRWHNPSTKTEAFMCDSLKYKLKTMITKKDPS